MVAQSLLEHPLGLFWYAYPHYLALKRECVKKTHPLVLLPCYWYGPRYLQPCSNVVTKGWTKRMKLCASCFRTAKLKISVFAPPCAGPFFCAGVFPVFLSDDESQFYKWQQNCLKGVVREIAVLSMIIKTCKKLACFLFKTLMKYIY